MFETIATMPPAVIVATCLALGAFGAFVAGHATDAVQRWRTRRVTSARLRRYTR